MDITHELISVMLTGQGDESSDEQGADIFSTSDSVEQPRGSAGTGASTGKQRDGSRLAALEFSKGAGSRRDGKGAEIPDDGDSSTAGGVGNAEGLELPKKKQKAGIKVFAAQVLLQLRLLRIILYRHICSQQ